jgi:hypothetical protein
MLVASAIRRCWCSATLTADLFLGDLRRERDTTGSGAAWNRDVFHAAGAHYLLKDFFVITQGRCDGFSGNGCFCFVVITLGIINGLINNFVGKRRLNSFLSHIKGWCFGMSTQIITQVEHLNWLWGGRFLKVWCFKFRYGFWFNSLLSDDINCFVSA